VSARRGFASDNAATIHPDVLAAIARANVGHAYGYGHDELTRALQARFREHFGERTSAYPVWGGSAANVLSLRATCRPWHAVICTQSAHLNVDECGAPEAIAGVKLLAAATDHGKLTPAAVEGLIERVGDEHAVQPRVVSISQCTELGTVYTLDELRALGELAHGRGLLVHMDGARLSNAAAALGASLRELTAGVGVDVLSFGGTKNGLLGAEAVVFLAPELDEGFEYLRKQSLQLASKMRFLAAQLDALLTDQLWLRCATQANTMAATLAERIESLPGVAITRPVQANAVFAQLPSADAIESLQREYDFYVWDERANEVRWMCSWDTTEEHERPDDIAALQALLDHSYATAGPHLLSIHTPDRRLGAEQVCRELVGVSVLALATVTSDGRPIVGPVDGILYRGAFHFGSSPDSVRARHLAARPEVSATHARGEELAVTIHGRAVPVDVRAEENSEFRQTLLDVYVPRYGAKWEQFLDSGPVFWRIDAERMFGFLMPPEPPAFARPLLEDDLDPDPFKQFEAWFQDAREADIRLPEAAALATATAGGRPSVRMVLVKQSGSGGFVFYSNYESRKGEELLANPRAALMFYWDSLGRQVRIEGGVSRLSAGESAAYVRSRPRASRLSALASAQSTPVASRDALERRVAELAAAHEGGELPVPANWGGFRLDADTLEFWQHREDRLHDRLRYRRADTGWEIERLAP
jgi:threonine aldolase